MQEQEQNRTEQATPFKLSEAKKRGQVAKSLEFNTLVVVVSLLTAMAIWGKSYWRAMCELCAQLFASAATLQITSESSPGIFSDIGARTSTVVMPFLLAGVIAAILANWVQTGPIISADPLKPKFERLNPAAGFKRMFSKKMLFEAIKSVIKLMFFGSIAYAFFLSSLTGLLTIGGYDADGQANWIAGLAIGLLFRLGLGLVVVGLIDITYVRWQHSQQMMMSRREMKEEVKRREGDPQIRAKIRELQRENLKQARSMGRLPDADVLITNPTHFAVALRYDRAIMNTPIVLAKGADNWAQEMKAVARKHGVPMFERRQLARQLFRRGVIEQPIPSEAFLDVARVYADLAQIRRNESRYEVQQS
jgi:flagellar biosynthetic protein FlhB